MKIIKTSIGRRSFIKRTALAGGGIVFSFNWLTSCDLTHSQVKALPKEWFKLNGFLKIGDNGLVTIMSPNPEIGQNIKTSMPMTIMFYNIRCEITYVLNIWLNSAPV